MMNLFAEAIFVCLCVMNLMLLRRTGWMCPHNLFVWFNMIMGIGILYQLDLSRPDDMCHAVVIFVSAFVYLISTVAFSWYFPMRREFKSYCNAVLITYSKLDVQVSFVLYVAALTASAVYFYLVGYNVLIYILMHGSSAGNITDMRLDAYSGSNYYAPGYFNQFKNVILPWSYVSLISASQKQFRSRVLHLLMSVILLIPVILCLLGTGQRAFFVGFIVSSLLFVGLASRGRLNISFGKLSIIVAGFFTLFSAMSAALGRSGGASFVSGITELLSRIFFEQQYGSVYGFRYIYKLPVQYGSDWGTDLLSIFPGFHGTHLSNIISGIVYGSDRGTVPISLWTSVYYNWGWLGVIIFPVLLALIYICVSRHILRKSRVTYLQLMCYSLLSFTLASWVSAGPMQLVNNGLVTLVILLVMLKIILSAGFVKVDKFRHHWA